MLKPKRKNFPTASKNKNQRRDTLPKIKSVPYPMNLAERLESVQGDTRVATLDFELVTSPFNNPGGGVTSELFKLNSVYDQLSSILTPSIQFFNYMFELYTYAKVLSMKLKLTFTTLEQFPIDLYWFESPNNPASSFPNVDAVEAMAGTGSCRWRDTLSVYGNKSCIQMVKIVIPGQILGNKREYDADLAYSCTVSTDPSIPIYGIWVAASYSPLTAGLTVKVSSSIRIKFYKRINLSSPIYKTLSTHEFLELIKPMLRRRRGKVSSSTECDTEKDNCEQRVTAGYGDPREVNRSLVHVPAPDNGFMFNSPSCVEKTQERSRPYSDVRRCRCDKCYLIPQTEACNKEKL